MLLESQKKTVNKTQQELFDYLTKYENYEQLMPENMQLFEVHESGEGFNVQLKGLPKVGMKLKETQAPEKIIFESPTDNFKYDLVVQIDKVEEDQSEIGITFDGKFNPMIEMMAKKPLQKFIDAIIENLD